MDKVCLETIPCHPAVWLVTPAGLSPSIEGIDFGSVPVYTAASKTDGFWAHVLTQPTADHQGPKSSADCLGPRWPTMRPVARSDSVIFLNFEVFSLGPHTLALAGFQLKDDLDFLFQVIPLPSCCPSNTTSALESIFSASTTVEPDLDSWLLGFLQE